MQAASRRQIVPGSFPRVMRRRVAQSGPVVIVAHGDAASEGMRHKMKKLHALALCLFAASLAGAATAVAADNWPVRPVRMIVGFTPGGPTDLIARLVGQG